LISFDLILFDNISFESLRFDSIEFILSSLSFVVLAPEVQKHYLGLYIKYKKQNMSAPEREEFDKLERKLTYENIWSSRLIGQAQLAKDKEKVRGIQFAIINIYKYHNIIIISFLYCIFGKSCQLELVGPILPDLHWSICIEHLQLRVKLVVDETREREEREGGG